MVKPEIKWINLSEKTKIKREIIEKKLNENIQKLITEQNRNEDA